MEKLLDIVSNSKLDNFSIKISKRGMNDIADRDDLVFITFSCRVGFTYPSKEFTVTKESLEDVGGYLINALLEIFTEVVEQHRQYAITP